MEFTFAHKHTDAKITIISDDKYEAMVSLVSTVQTPNHWIMLDKALQQPEGKINEHVLYTEDEAREFLFMGYNLRTMDGHVRSTKELIDYFNQHKKH